ncbi:hypothetical protein E4T39_06924 [Aureobasidium subglaciale]|nr:hypothetical protein E4T39_06924 [Aureobasidium subglaciale]
MAGLINPCESGHSAAQVDHARNGSITNQASDSVTPFRPHFHRQCYTVETFRDFYTPDPGSIIYAVGPLQSLSSLERTLTSSGDVAAMRYDQTADLSPWVPLIVALNTVCAQVGLQPISETDLQKFLQSPWFQDFVKQSAKYHKFEDELNLDNLASVSAITEDHMVVVLEAFAACHSLEKIELGILHIQKECIKATHYPWTATADKHTAWIIVDHRFCSIVFHGLGRPIIQKQVAVADQDSDDDSSDEEEKEEEEDDVVGHLPKASISTPRNAVTAKKVSRDTASRIVAQRTPLKAGLTVDDILQNHVDRLHYNNILKVGLRYSNAEMAKKVHEADAATKQQTDNEPSQKGASGIVKRINTAIKHVEDMLNIKSGAFRTAYDRERKTNNVPIRGKDEVSDADLATFATQIDGAMAWIQSGGPRPPTLVPYGTTSPAGLAPVSTAASATTVITAPAAHAIDQYPSMGHVTAPYYHSSQMDTSPDDHGLNNGNNYSQIKYADDEMDENEDLGLA